MSRALCLEVQTLLLDAGFDDVEIAPLKYDDGNVYGFDLRVTLDCFPEHENGFLDRLLMMQAGTVTARQQVPTPEGGMPVFVLKWVLSNVQMTLEGDKLAQLLYSEPVLTAKRIIRRRGLAIMRTRHAQI